MLFCCIPLWRARISMQADLVAGPAVGVWNICQHATNSCPDVSRDISLNTLRLTFLDLLYLRYTYLYDNTYLFSDLYLDGNVLVHYSMLFPLLSVPFSLQSAVSQPQSTQHFPLFLPFTRVNSHWLKYNKRAE
jgi:hypothetical protein